ncbi:MAG: hypothetical protein ACE5H4_03955 [Candidatus Thorarchaeota archaeon]
MGRTSPNVELYGVSPTQIAEIMIIITLLVPYGVIPRDLSWMFLQDFFYPEDVFYSLLWVFTPRPYDPFLIAFIRPDVLLFTVSFSVFNMVFALKVVRFYQDWGSKSTVIVYGLVSLIMPSIMLTVWLSITSFPFAVLGVVWPLPIQFLVGIGLVHFVRGPVLAQKDEERVGKASLAMEELDELYDE